MAQPPFIVTSENAINALPRWLAGIHCNTYSHDGGTKISVGYLRGRRYSYTASIIVRDTALFDVTLEVVKTSLTSGQGK